MSDLYEKIKEAKEILGNKQAEIIADGYPLEEWDETKGSAKSIFNPNDNTPSMMWNKKEYYFKDFSTGKTYGIIDFYIQKHGDTFVKAAKRLFQEAGIEYSSDLLDFSQTQENKDFFRNYKYPREEQQANDVVIKYMQKRGISEKTCRYIGLGVGYNNAIAYQFRNHDGKIVQVKYRPSHAIRNGEPKYYYQKDADTCPILFNIDKIDVTKTLCVCEGMNDAMAIIESGFSNVVSIPSGAEDDNWINFNYEFLDQFDDIVLWYDNDNAGEIGVKKVIPRLGEYRVRIAKPTEEDEAAVEKYYKDVTQNENLSIRKTDANNILLGCGAARVLAIINQAEEVPIDSLIDIFDAPDFNILETDYIPSGLADFDSQIYGFVPSTFNLWLGGSGMGKSSVVSQVVVAEAVEHNKNVFWVSMESLPSQSKDWLMSQLCGRRHMVEYVSKSGFHYYKPTLEAKKAVSEYYKGKIFLYDNLILSSPETILEKMKYSYKRCGTTVFVIDNLMCLNFNGVSESETSGKMVDWFNKLINFTKNYGVTTHLVVHPRKTIAGLSQPLTQMDIYGSSCIGNLCDRLFCIEKPFNQMVKEQGCDRELVILKDRPLSRQGAVAGLFYDRVTRRLRSVSDDKYKTFSWDDGRIQYQSEDYNGGVIVGNRTLDIDIRDENNMPY